MKAIIPLLCFAFFAKSVFSQFTYIGNENALLLADRTIIVELLNEKGEDESANLEAKRVNSLLESVIEKQLKIGQKVELMDESEIKFALKSKKTKYAFLYHELNSITYESSIERKYDKNGKRTVGHADYSTKNIGKTRFHFDIILAIYGDQEAEFRGKKEITVVGFGHKKLTESDYLFAVQQFNMLYDAGLSNLPISQYRDVRRNMERLSEVTLVVAEDQIGFKKTPNHGYEHPIEFVSEQTQIEELATSREKGKAYIKLVWSSYEEIFFWVIVDAKSGRVLSQLTYLKSNGYQIKDEPYAKVDARTFKELDSEYGNKVNNPYLTPAEKRKVKNEFCTSGQFCKALFCL